MCTFLPRYAPVPATRFFFIMCVCVLKKREKHRLSYREKKTSGREGGGESTADGRQTGHSWLSGNAEGLGTGLGLYNQEWVNWCVFSN